MAVHVGQRVSTNIEHAWLYVGVEGGQKMRKPRNGTIIEVPEFAERTGAGTVKVRWDSLDGSDNSNDKKWVRWCHTDLIHLNEDPALNWHPSSKRGFDLIEDF